MKNKHDGTLERKQQSQKFVGASIEEVQRHFDLLRVEQMERKLKDKRKKGIVNVDLEKQHKKLMNVLAREVNFLLAASEVGKLDQNQSKDLVNYLKLIQDLKEEQEEIINDLTDEELQAAAQDK